MNRRPHRCVFAFEGPRPRPLRKAVDAMTIDAVSINAMDQLAIGLVHLPDDRPRGDRTWARALVVRHARDARLQLVDILELDDEPRRARAVLTRLGDVAAVWNVTVLLTDGLEPHVARSIALDLGLEHQAVAAPGRPSWVE